MTKRAIKRLMAKDGSTYTGKDGSQKNGYTRCGVLLKDDQTGEAAIKINTLPVNFDGWISFWDMEGDKVKQDAGLNQSSPQQYQQQQAPQQYQQQQAPQQYQQQQAPQGFDDFDDDIPF